MPKLPKIATNAADYLVLPMPRLGMGTLRVDGHLLRVRRCPRCGLHTTIAECPVCATTTTTPSPEEPPRLRPSPKSNAIIDTTIDIPEVGQFEAIMPWKRML